MSKIETALSFEDNPRARSLVSRTKTRSFGLDSLTAVAHDRGAHVLTGEVRTIESRIESQSRIESRKRCARASGGGARVLAEEVRGLVQWHKTSFSHGLLEWFSRKDLNGAMWRVWRPCEGMWAWETRAEGVPRPARLLWRLSRISRALAKDPEVTCCCEVAIGEWTQKVKWESNWTQQDNPESSGAEEA